MFIGLLYSVHNLKSNTRINHTLSNHEMLSNYTIT